MAKSRNSAVVGDECLKHETEIILNKFQVQINGHSNIFCQS